jgi:hypothetical protein
MKITIPETPNEIYLKDYQKYMKIAMENEDNVNLLNIKAVEIFCNIRMKDVHKIKASDFDDIVNVLGQTLSKENKFVQRFKIGDVEYGFIPNLDDISLGEYVDIESYLPDVDNLHKAMAVLYRPITYSTKDMYLIDEYKGSDELSDVMKFAPLDAVLGAQVFFYNLSNELMRHTMDYLGKQGKKNTRVKQVLEENGDGIKAFMQLLEGNLQPLTMS